MRMNMRMSTSKKFWIGIAGLILLSVPLFAQQIDEVDIWRKAYKCEIMLEKSQNSVKLLTNERDTLKVLNEGLLKELGELKSKTTAPADNTPQE